MKSLLKKVRFRAARVVHPRKCPCCAWHGPAFLPAGEGILLRSNAKCPWCNSRERHRAAYLLMRDRLARGGWTTLHVSPEKPLVPWLQRVSADYLSIDLDLSQRVAMRQMDVTNLELPDASRTLVWCSHVLEHVPDDRRALREMFRVLHPDGLAVIQVPLIGLRTTEDPTLTDPAERLRRFLQADHVRIYGLDIIDRLTEAGFNVLVRRTDELPPRVIYRHAPSFFISNEVFVCTKTKR